MNLQKSIQERQHSTLFYHSEKDYLHVWIKASPKYINEYLLKKELIQFKHYIQSTQAKIVVINIQNYAASITASCADWLKSHFLEAVAQVGLRRVSVAYGHNIMAAIDLENIIRRQQSFSYDLGVFSDESEAIRWGHQLPKK